MHTSSDHESIYYPDTITSPPNATSTSPVPQAPQLPLRKSFRISTKQQWLNDFIASISHCDLVPSSTSEAFFAQYFTPSTVTITHSYAQFIANISIIKEPKSYQEAIGDNNWMRAMQAEISALENNHTWYLTTLPTGKKAIPCK